MSDDSGRLGDGVEGYGSHVHGDVVFALFGLATISGAILFAGYALPETVGSVIGGEVFLVAGVSFFGSFLVLLSVAPEPN